MTAEIILSFFSIALIISKAVEFRLFFLIPFEKKPSKFVAHSTLCKYKTN